MKKQTVFIWVSGGLVQSVTDENLKSSVNHIVIDYDNREYGSCIICGDNPDYDPDKPCEVCGYDYSKDVHGEEAVRVCTKYFKLED